MLKLHKISCSETVEETLEIRTNFRVCVCWVFFFFLLARGKGKLPQKKTISKLG